MKIVALVFASVLLMSAIALKPEWGGSYKLWGALLGVYGGWSGFALYRMWNEGTLKAILTPRRGDFAIGAAAAFVLLLGSWLARARIAPPGSEAQAWLAYVYLLIGDPNVLQRSLLLTASLLLVATFEEIVWRVLVLDQLMQRLGARRAWPISALLYALALAPTAYTLRAEPLGYNPLLPLAALGCGLVWGLMGRLFGRLWPMAFSHMVFSYFSATQFRLPGF
jgi:membrane protease YdiL (CAAX protease family)